MHLTRLPSFARTLRRLTGATALLLTVALPAGAVKGPEILATIPLGDLGYTPTPARLLLNGEPGFTVHFVDPTHLLVTFAAHGLITRRAGARAEDADRNVAALLIELPSGKVLHRATWRLQDHNRYLWPLGHGHFLLREGSAMRLVSPLDPARREHPLEATPFLEAAPRQRIGYIAVSPGGDLLSVETVHDTATTPEAAIASAAGPNDVRIAFYRLRETHHDGGEELAATPAGIVRAPGLVHIPATAAGYLDAKQEAKNVWDFDFQPHEGKRLELAAYDSTCLPRADWISSSEFLGFGCMGADEKKAMAGFNLRGEENWIYPFSGPYVYPSTETAPAAGRFALSRTVLTGSYIDLSSLAPDQVSAQEVLVMQNGDGRTLMKLRTTPVQTAGGNFALSPDGLALAAVQDEKIVVYRLPPLTRKDEAAVQAALKDAPALNEARITLGGRPVTATAAAAEVEQPAPTAARAASTSSADITPAAPQESTVPATGDLGDVQEGRKPPQPLRPRLPEAVTAATLRLLDAAVRSSGVYSVNTDFR